jgi:hypothetical protein
MWKLANATNVYTYELSYMYIIIMKRTLYTGTLTWKVVYIILVLKIVFGQSLYNWACMVSHSHTLPVSDVIFMMLDQLLVFQKKINWQFHTEYSNMNGWTLGHWAYGCSDADCQNSLWCLWEKDNSILQCGRGHVPFSLLSVLYLIMKTVYLSYTMWLRNLSQTDGLCSK